jgi:hypothetical protein
MNVPGNYLLMVVDRQKVLHSRTLFKIAGKVRANIDLEKTASESPRDRFALRPAFSSRSQSLEPYFQGSATAPGPACHLAGGENPSFSVPCRRIGFVL